MYASFFIIHDGFSHIYSISTDSDNYRTGPQHSMLHYLVITSYSIIQPLGVAITIIPLLMH